MLSQQIVIHSLYAALLHEMTDYHKYLLSHCNQVNSILDHYLEI